MRNILCGVVFLAASTAHACSCAGPGACSAFYIQDTLFVGKAISVRIIDAPIGGNKYRRRVFRFEVSEALAGAPREGQQVEVETGMGGGDCGYTFLLGESYVVDASHYGQNGGLSTGICQGTRPESEAHNLLREIHAVLSHGRLPDLSGTIYEKRSMWVSTPMDRPLQDILVRLTAADGTSYTTTTDSEGIYSFLSLPPASYNFDAVLPLHRVPYGVDTRQPQTLEIPRSGGTGAACHNNITALPSGTISGQVVDASGKGYNQTGFLTLRAPGAATDEQSNIYIQPDGRFTIPFVAAGEYRLVFRSYGPLHESWTPSGPAHPLGTIVVQDGQSIDDIQIVVK